MSSQDRKKITDEEANALTVYAIEGLLKQGKAGGIEGMCFYRIDCGTSTLSCGVGLLIKDEFYNTGLEEQTANSEDVVLALEESIGLTLTGYAIGLLSELQSAHDRCSSGVHEAFEDELFTSMSTELSLVEIWEAHKNKIH